MNTFMPEGSFFLYAPPFTCSSAYWYRGWP